MAFRNAELNMALMQNMGIVDPKDFVIHRNSPRLSTFQDIKFVRLVGKDCKNASQQKRSERGILTLDFKKLPASLEFVEEKQIARLYSNVLVRGIYDACMWDPTWGLYGTHVKALELSGCTFINADQFRKLIFVWTPNLQKLILGELTILGDETGFNHYMKNILFSNSKKVEFEENWNLKSLTVEMHHLEEVNPHISWMELLSQFPGLQDITVKGRNSSLDKLFKTINIIRRQDASKLCLDRITTLVPASEVKTQPVFHLHTPEQSAFFRFISNPVTHLRSVSLEVKYENFVKTNCTIFSKHEKKTKTLSTQSTEVADRWIFHNPPPVFNKKSTNLHNVTELVLLSPVFTTFEFLKFTPNLTKLKMLNHRQNPSIIALTAKGNMKNVKLEHCRGFEFSNLLPREELQSVMEWLPNVETLRMPLDNATFRLICKNWNNLANLEIPESLVDDCGMIGLNKQFITMRNEKEDDRIELLPPMAPMENLSNLTKLQRLVIIAHRDHQLSLDNSVTQFGKLANLQQLIIHGYKLDENIWNDLRAQYNLSNCLFLHPIIKSAPKSSFSTVHVPSYVALTTSSSRPRTLNTN